MEYLQLSVPSAASSITVPNRHQRLLRRFALVAGQPHQAAVRLKPQRSGSDRRGRVRPDRTLGDGTTSDSGSRGPDTDQGREGSGRHKTPSGLHQRELRAGGERVSDVERDPAREAENRRNRVSDYRLHEGLDIQRKAYHSPFPEAAMVVECWIEALLNLDKIPCPAGLEPYNCPLADPAHSLDSIDSQFPRPKLAPQPVGKMQVPA